MTVPADYAFTAAEWNAVASCVGDLSCVRVWLLVDGRPEFLRYHDRGEGWQATDFGAMGVARPATLEDLRLYIELATFAALDSESADNDADAEAAERRSRERQLRSLRTPLRRIEKVLTEMGLAEEESLKAALGTFISLENFLRPKPQRRGAPGRDERWTSFCRLLRDLWINALNRPATASASAPFVTFLLLSSVPLRRHLRVNVSEEAMIKFARQLVRDNKMTSLERRLGILLRLASQRSAWKKIQPKNRPNFGDGAVSS